MATIPTEEINNFVQLLLKESRYHGKQHTNKAGVDKFGKHSFERQYFKVNNG